MNEIKSSFFLTGKELRVARLTGSQLQECRELYQADKTVSLNTQYIVQRAQFYDPDLERA